MQASKVVGGCGIYVHQKCVGGWDFVHQKCVGGWDFVHQKCVGGWDFVHQKWAGGWDFVHQKWAGRWDFFDISKHSLLSSCIICYEAHLQQHFAQ